MVENRVYYNSIIREFSREYILSVLFICQNWDILLKNITYTVHKPFQESSFKNIVAI